MILYVAYVGRHPEGSRKKIRKEHALAAGFMPKYGRLASECLEKSEEFFNSSMVMVELASGVSAIYLRSIVAWFAD